MKRSTFLKSLAALFVAPKIISEIGRKAKVPPSIFKDLKFVEPIRPNELFKYNEQSFTDIMKHYDKYEGSTSYKFYHFQTSKIEETNEPRDPITIVLTKEEVL